MTTDILIKSHYGRDIKARSTNIAITKNNTPSNPATADGGFFPEGITSTSILT